MYKAIALLILLQCQTAIATTIQSQDVPPDLLFVGTVTAAGFKLSPGGFLTLGTGSTVYSEPGVTFPAPTGAAGGDLSGNYPNPTVSKVNGVLVSGVPSVGQSITATSPTAASWQTVGGGAGLPASGGTMTGPLLMSDLQSIKFSTNTGTTSTNASIGFSTQTGGKIIFEAPPSPSATSSLFQFFSSGTPTNTDGVTLIFSTVSAVVPGSTPFGTIKYSTTTGIEVNGGKAGLLKIGDGLNFSGDSAAIATPGGTTAISGSTLDLSGATTIKVGGVTNRSVCVNTSGNLVFISGACP